MFFKLEEELEKINVKLKSIVLNGKKDDVYNIGIYFEDEKAFDCFINVSITKDCANDIQSDLLPKILCKRIERHIEIDKKQIDLKKRKITRDFNELMFLLKRFDFGYKFKPIGSLEYINGFEMDQKIQKLIFSNNVFKKFFINYRLHILFGDKKPSAKQCLQEALND